MNFNALSLAEVQVWGQGGGAGGAGGATDVEWIVSDQLGTPRMVVDQSGARAGVKRHDYLPFGEELFAGSGGRTTSQGYSASDGVRQKFTKYERDDETGLDYAQARYYAALQGRFTSTDPMYFQIMMAVDPQRLNLYAYARNNPLKWIDPSGETLYLRGDSDWLRINVLYGMVGGQGQFDHYFEIRDGQVMARSGVDSSDANEGVKELLGIVSSAAGNYIYFAGGNETANEMARLFQGTFTTDKKGKERLTDFGNTLVRNFTGDYEDNHGGYVSGTLGRGSGSAEPAELANHDPVFAVIACNTAMVQTQTGVDARYPIQLEEQHSGVGKIIAPSSFFIHESAEKRKFAEIGASNENYRKAHIHAQNREAIIRRNLGITGGYAGGVVRSTVPRR